MIAFVKRCRKDTTAVSRREIWRSPCGRYRVVFSQCRFGPRKGPPAITSFSVKKAWEDAFPYMFYAEVRDPVTGRWNILSKHGNPEPAFRACERSAAENR